MLKKKRGGFLHMILSAAIREEPSNWRCGTLLNRVRGLIMQFSKVTNLTGLCGSVFSIRGGPRFNDHKESNKVHILSYLFQPFYHFQKLPVCPSIGPIAVWALAMGHLNIPVAQDALAS